MGLVSPYTGLLSGGPEFRAWTQGNVVQTIGRWAGKPLVFEEWQGAFFDDAMEIDVHTGRRVYHEVVKGVPRKNGKSTGAGAVGLHLTGADGYDDPDTGEWIDENSPEVYGAAAAKDQARVIFNQMKAFIKVSPTLQDYFRARQYHIECPANNGVFRVVSSDAPKQYGFNNSGNVVDELWAHESGDLYTAMTTGSGAREQPFTLTLTTAGWDPESVLGVLYERARNMPDIEQRGEYLWVARDRSTGFLMYWYGATDDHDPEDPAVWMGCNPASWITEKYLRSERMKPALQRLADFQRLHLNQWTIAEEPWLPAGSWVALKDKALWAIQNAPGLVRPDGGDDPARIAAKLALLDSALPVGVGIDMGQTYDSVGVTVAQHQGDRCVVVSRGWQNPYPANHPLYTTWRVNQEHVRQYLRELRQQFPAAMASEEQYGRTIPLPGPAFAYDPWHFSESAATLTQDGLNMVEFHQYASKMVPASEMVYQMVKDKRLWHDGDTILAQHVGAAVAELTPRGWRIAKGKKAKRRIDRAVSMAMAVWQAMQEAPEQPKRKGKGSGHSF